MTSMIICQNFVQNAWKKELCSNCFKSKNEHQNVQRSNLLKPLFSKKIESIIKTSNRNTNINSNNRCVRFPNQLTEVIGYGGEDWSSDIEENNEKYDENNADFEYFSDDSSDELKKITKANTNYNSTSLQQNYDEHDMENKKSYASLMLGKPIIDSDGKKKTLLVPVRPFGEEIPTPRKITKTKNKKETATETNTNVILTSYVLKNSENVKREEKSLLDEIAETLENTKKDAVQIIARRKNVNNEEKNGETLMKSEKKITLTRTPALKREHASIYHTSTAKYEFMNNKNKIHNKENTDNSYSEKEQNIDEEDIIMTSTAIKNEINKKSSWELPNIEDDKSSTPDSSLSSNNDFENVTLLSQTREQVGEPDGRADSDNSEPPALPLTPPPSLETQQTAPASNNNPTVQTKPKIPSKPSNTMLIRKTQHQHHFEMKPPQILTTFSSPQVETVNSPTSIIKTNSNGSDVIHISKRRAPKPPDETGIFLRKPLSSNAEQQSAPVLREIEKRERASSCPKLPNITTFTQNHSEFEATPEPAPRKSLSVSTDSLANMDDNNKRRDKSKAKFSLKKFLRMGSNKELSKLPLDSYKFDHVDSTVPPLPKPRLVIVHPSELNGAKVEVVKTQCETNNSNEYENVKNVKPPTPPRNFEEITQKPPLNPKSQEVVNSLHRVVSRNNSFKKEETVYANIGEVRSSIVPNKPVRTASMREREAAAAAAEASKTKQNENLNFGKNSSLECLNNNHIQSEDEAMKIKKRSESTIDISQSNDYFKYNSVNGNIPRSLSLTYCGSETESEIYSPYNFYGSENEVTEDDHEWTQNGRTCKLRSRKGRSIVHKNLEDNYGAVIVANHEALAQVLENIQQTVHTPNSLRGLKSSNNLRWCDFTLLNTSAITLGKRTFHQALWGTHQVTLAINRGVAPSCTLSLGTFNLIPVTEFNDLIPSKYLDGEVDSNKEVQATITVLPWMQVDTIQSYAGNMKNDSNYDKDNDKDILFVLLQLVNALKHLQAQGIEELPISLSSFLLCKDMEKDVHQKLFVLQSLSEELSNKTTEKFSTLCNCASKALQILKPKSQITSLIQSLLNNERATSLTQVKSVLEFSLWGPSDVSLGTTIRDRELTLQRWLDLQRATVLHGLVCTRVQLTVYEEYHLLFLVRSNARLMCDASLLLESNNKKNLHLN